MKFLGQLLKLGCFGTVGIFAIIFVLAAIFGNTSEETANDTKAQTSQSTQSAQTAVTDSSLVPLGESDEMEGQNF
ncbi:MAG: hypothetical protein ACFBSC_09375 [Microcoleaceae cyanobacterium]